MSHTCLRTEELPALLARPADDARRREAEHCARCRSLLASYREFAHPSPAPAGANPADAETRLAAALDAEIFGHTGGTPERWAPSTATARPPRSARDTETGGFFRRLWQPVLRPAWGVAVVLLALWGAQSTGLFESRGRRGTELRAGEFDAGASVRLLAPVAMAGGELRLSWSEVPTADRYELVLHGSGYAERMRLDAGPKPARELAAETIAELRESGGPLYWRVIAYRNGDPIAESAIEPLAEPTAR